MKNSVGEARQLGETAFDHQPGLRLLGLLAHQISQPLTVLLGEVELALRFQHSEAELKGTLDRCFRNLGNMGRLVGDFRILGEMSKATIVFVPLAKLVGGVVEAQRSEAGLKDLRIDWNALEDANVETDAEVLQRAFSIVLGKAVRTSPTGGAVEVRLDRRRGNAQFKLSYSEAGCGSEVSKSRDGTALENLFPGRAAAAGDTEWSLAGGMIQLLGGSLEVYRVTGPGSQIRLAMTLAVSRGISSAAAY
ncbi:MAG: sensor histidine kinase [Terriglobia bacterium]